MHQLLADNTGFRSRVDHSVDNADLEEFNFKDGAIDDRGDLGNTYIFYLAPYGFEVFQYGWLRVARIGMGTVP